MPTVTVTCAGETATVTYGAVATVLRDFTANNGTIAAMLKGSTAAGTWTLAPMSSTKAALANALTAGQTNPYYLLRTPRTAGLTLANLTITGTPQGHDYGGLMIDHCDSATLTDSRITAIPGSSSSPPGETFGVNVYGGTSVTLTRVEIDGAGVTASGIGVNSATAVELDDCYVHDCPHGMPTFWQTNGVTTRNLRSINNHLGVNHERVTGPVRHYGLELDVPAKTGQMHLTLNNDQADNPDVEIHLARWAGGHYGATGPLCVMISDGYRGAQKQTSLPRIYGPNGNLLQWADAGSATVKAVNVAAALANPTGWAVRFH